MARPIYEIAEDIIRDYRENGKRVPPAADAYVTPMLWLSDITDTYGFDSADMILRYALSNLTVWRGEKAREIKAEIRAMLK